MNPIIDLLLSHRSVRKFKNEPVKQSVLTDLVKIAQCAPTSHHVQAYAIIQVSDQAKKEKISDLAGNQPWVKQAPVFLVFCADLTRLESACEIHGVTPETGRAEQMIVATVDTALMAQNLMVSAESMGLGGVFIGGIRNDPARLCGILNIPDHAYPVFGMCLGVPDHTPDIKPRLPVELVLRKDTFQGGLEKKDKAALLKEYDIQMNRYYLSRDSNLKDQTWTGQVAGFWNHITRPHMKSFLEKRGFFLK